jgi:hypothetical protein
VKHCENDHQVALDGEIHGVGEAPQQRPADAGSEVLIRERTVCWMFDTRRAAIENTGARRGIVSG